MPDSTQNDTPFVGFNERDVSAAVDVAATCDTDAPQTIKRRKIARYGWRPDTPDFRDRIVPHVRAAVLKKLPITVDQEHAAYMPPIMDQGQLGSCTGNGIGGAFRQELRKQGLPDFEPSRLAIYFDERVVEHTVDQDAGAEIRDGIKVIAKIGAGSEALWPYDIAKFTTRPSAEYYVDAAKHRCISYERVPQDEQHVKQAIADGFSIVFGISVYDSFESEKVAATGVVPMPKTSESMLGGHCIRTAGYTKTRIKCANSWGTSWGKRGFFTIPLDYVLNPDLASDFWIIRVVQ